MEIWKSDARVFVRQCLGVTPEPWQDEVLAEVSKTDRIAIRSGHGVGKSALLAWIIVWWLITRYPAKVACTAPTGHQLEDVLWGELARWAREMKEPFRRWIEVKSDRVVLVSAPSESFAVARTARKEQPEAFQGFHSDNMLFIVDEASGVEDIIFEVGAGAMSTEGAKTIMAANPTRTSGYFYEAFHRMRAMWKRFTVPCSASSRVSQSFLDEMALKYGADSNIYRVRVLGEFPASEDDAVIPLHLCETALKRDIEQLRYKPVWGVDVARFGSDRTAIAKRMGNKMVAKVQSWAGKDTMQVAGLIMDQYRQADEMDKPSEILVDVIGIGAGVVDRLRELGLPVRGINVAESASVNDRFMRLRDELWWKAREWLADPTSCLIEDDDLIAELTGVKYELTSGGKLKIEGKDEMKKRGLRSPDLADAFVLTFAGGLERREIEEFDRYARKRRSRGSWMAA